MTISISNTEAIAALDLIVDTVDTDTVQANPTLNIYSGTPPALVDDALSGNTLLASLAMSNPAFGAAADDTPGAIVTANAIADDTSADATGTATFFRIFDRQASPKARLQGAVRGSADADNGEELVLNANELVAGALVEVTSLTITFPEG